MFWGCLFIFFCSSIKKLIMRQIGQLKPSAALFSHFQLKQGSLILHAESVEAAGFRSNQSEATPDSTCITCWMWPSVDQQVWLLIGWKTCSMHRFFAITIRRHWSKACGLFHVTSDKVQESGWAPIPKLKACKIFLFNSNIFFVLIYICKTPYLESHVSALISWNIVSSFIKLCRMEDK